MGEAETMNQEYRNGMTVAELKVLVVTFPEKDDDGGDNLVWMHTGRSLSSVVTYACSVGPDGDIIFDNPDAWEKR